jgi:hypothetical protein
MKAATIVGILLIILGIAGFTHPEHYFPDCGRRPAGVWCPPESTQFPKA